MIESERGSDTELSLQVNFCIRFVCYAVFSSQADSQIQKLIK
jgi:hypothetical protein